MPFPRLQAFLLAVSALLLILGFAISNSIFTQVFVSVGFVIFFARALSYASRIEEEQEQSQKHRPMDA